MAEQPFSAVYRFAGRRVAICALHPDVHTLCADYRAEGAADFSVTTTRADVDFERRRSAREDELEGVPVRQFSDGYLETLAVCRRIAERMPEYDTVLFHGSCVAVDGAAYLFAAKSGTGKSTHARLWRELLGDRAVMVNDDKPLLRVSREEGVTAFGTPWNGKHRLGADIAVPLKGLCILERAEKNTIRPISRAEACPMLLQQVYRPLDGGALKKTLALIDALAEGVRLWRLGCNMEPEAARVAYEAMKED